MTLSVRTLGTGLAGMLPAEHMHFMIDSAEAVDVLNDSVVTPLVTQREITELELIVGGMENSKWTDGLQKTSVWPDLVSVQATASKAVNDTSWPNLRRLKKSHQCSLDYFGLVLAEVQMASAKMLFPRASPQISAGRSCASWRLTCRIARCAARRCLKRQSASKKM